MIFLWYLLKLSHFCKRDVAKTVGGWSLTVGERSNRCCPQTHRGLSSRGPRPPTPPNAPNLIYKVGPFRVDFWGLLNRIRQKSLLSALFHQLLYISEVFQGPREFLFYFLFNRENFCYLRIATLCSFGTKMIQSWLGSQDDINITTHFHLLLSLLLNTKNIDTVYHRTL